MSYLPRNGDEGGSRQHHLPHCPSSELNGKTDVKIRMHRKSLDFVKSSRNCIFHLQSEALLIYTLQLCWPLPLPSPFPWPPGEISGFANSASTLAAMPLELRINTGWGERKRKGFYLLNQVPDSPLLQGLHHLGGRTFPAWFHICEPWRESPVLHDLGVLTGFTRMWLKPIVFSVFDLQCT